MKQEELEKLAAAWVKLHEVDEKSVEYKLWFWAYSCLDELIDRDPLLSFDVIKKILDIDKTDAILSNLAAGPMEDLLCRHGNEVINQVVKSAKDSQRFKRLLGAVWQNSIPEPIWVQVKAVSSATW